MRLTILVSFLLVCAAQVDPNEQEPKLKPSDTIPKVLGEYNIPVEEHWVTTDDGYILKSFRLVRRGAPVLLLQHGLLDSSWCWLINSPSMAPGIQLYNEGYDVWLPNSRGNTYSRNHTTLNVSLDKKFWNFTFVEMGRFDVPANIKYILAATGKKDLTYAGWSQGATQFFVSMTDSVVRPYVQKHINLFVALSPVTWMKYQTSRLFTGITKLHLDDVLDTVFPYGFLEEGGGVDTFAQIMCKLTLGEICKFTVDLFCGHSPLDTRAAITNETAHFPAGTSAKELRHYAQSIRDGTFNLFDYGPKGNLKQYGQEKAPAILTGEGEKTISVPTALFVGQNDALADVQDVANLTGHFGNKSMLVFQRVFGSFSHMTWFDGTPGSFYNWYPAFSALLHKYSPVQREGLVV